MEPVLLMTAPGEGEYEEKKSRFLALAVPVRTEAEASDVLQARRKAHPDARHHCYAFVCGPHSELTRSSDDGEPSGTGGRPILDVLFGSGMHNALIVVTRYFGGTLLGTGGLTRAYSSAAAEALRQSEKAYLYSGELWQIMVSYSDYSRLDRLMDSLDIARRETLFETDVIQEICILPEQKEEFFRQLADVTSGEAAAEQIGPVCFLKSGKKALLYEAP